MAIIKCKMCGGDITIAADKTFGTCEYCGSTMTLPKVDDDQRAAAFNRGNHFRRIGEFDKALAVYERIVAEDNTDAEAHWCCALCRFGIEYVEDPATYEYLPTCHRASFDSILEDVDYLAAVEYSDGITRRQYQKDAAKIAEVQRGILATSSQEEPFDVFICYKESDAEGNRTRDSLLAQEVYYQLTEQGYRVFFSRITLEDKVGAQYEPYIFAALNSAKVMVAIGTKEEYFNAVWVKNEWSRFLALMKKDRSKLLLPCYRDMDPYDMPEALSVLQSYDMSKIGFIQDLVRGIGKVLRTEPAQTVKETVVVQSQQASSTNIAPLLKRAFMFLEDRDWESAEEYCEKVLDIDPECADAYLCKALVEEECESLEAFIEERIAFGSEVEEETATIPADEAHVQEMVSKYEIKNFLTEEEIRNLYRFDLSYRSAVAGCQQKSSEEEAYWKNHKLLSRAVRFAEGEETEVLRAKERVFSALNENIKAAEREEESACQDLQARYAVHLAVTNGKVAQRHAEAQEHRENYYQQWTEIVRTGTERSALESAAHALVKLDGYKESQSLISFCNERIDEMNAEAAAEAEAILQAQAAEEARLAAIKAEEDRFRAIEAKKRAAKRKKIAAICAAVAGVAIAAFLVATKVVVPNTQYKNAVALMENGQYEQAIAAFEALDGYKDSGNLIFEAKYREAILLLERGEGIEAYEAFLNLDGYKDSAEKIKAIYEQEFKSVDVGNYIFFGTYEQNNDTNDGREAIEWLVLETNGSRALVISKYALDYKRYNERNTDITWETCSLRKWLNEDFLDSAFSDSEKAIIPAVTVSADRNPEYGTSVGNATEDQVFLLSITEANKYFGSDSARQCKPTDYAVANGAGDNSSSDNSYWWLRSPGKNRVCAAYVFIGGGISEMGSGITNHTFVVRPAMWIDLNA